MIQQQQPFHWNFFARRRPTCTDGRESHINCGRATGMKWVLRDLSVQNKPQRFEDLAYTSLSNLWFGPERVSAGRLKESETCLEFRFTTIVREILKLFDTEGSFSYKWNECNQKEKGISRCEVILQCSFALASTFPTVESFKGDISQHLFYVLGYRQALV